MRALGRGPAGVLLTLLVACGPRSGADPRDLAPDAELCYAFERNQAAESLRLPWGFGLSGTPSGPQGAHEAVTLSEEGGRSPNPINYWRVVGDSLEMGSATMGSLQVVLGGTGARLGGRARATGDIIRPGDPPRPEATGVVAEMVSCPAG